MVEWMKLSRESRWASKAEGRSKFMLGQSFLIFLLVCVVFVLWFQDLS